MILDEAYEELDIEPNNPVDPSSPSALTDVVIANTKVIAWWLERAADAFDEAQVIVSEYSGMFLPVRLKTPVHAKYNLNDMVWLIDKAYEHLANLPSGKPYEPTQRAINIHDYLFDYIPLGFGNLLGRWPTHRPWEKEPMEIMERMWVKTTKPDIQEAFARYSQLIMKYNKAVRKARTLTLETIEIRQQIIHGLRTRAATREMYEAYEELDPPTAISQDQITALTHYWFDLRYQFEQVDEYLRALFKSLRYSQTEYPDAVAYRSWGPSQELSKKFSRPWTQIEAEHYRPTNPPVALAAPHEPWWLIRAWAEQKMGTTIHDMDDQLNAQVHSQFDDHKFMVSNTIDPAQAEALESKLKERNRLVKRIEKFVISLENNERLIRPLVGEGHTMSPTAAELDEAYEELDIPEVTAGSDEDIFQTYMKYYALDNQIMNMIRNLETRPSQVPGRAAAIPAWLITSSSTGRLSPADAAKFVPLPTIKAAKIDHTLLATQLHKRNATLGWTSSANIGQQAVDLQYQQEITRLNKLIAKANVLASVVTKHINNRKKREEQKTRDRMAAHASKSNATTPVNIPARLMQTSPTVPKTIPNPYNLQTRQTPSGMSVVVSDQYAGPVPGYKLPIKETEFATKVMEAIYKKGHTFDVLYGASVKLGDSTKRDKVWAIVFGDGQFVWIHDPWRIQKAAGEVPDWTAANIIWSKAANKARPFREGNLSSILMWIDKNLPTKPVIKEAYEELDIADTTRTGDVAKILYLKILYYRWTQKVAEIVHALKNIPLTGPNQKAMLGEWDWSRLPPSKQDLYDTYPSIQLFTMPDPIKEDAKRIPNGTVLLRQATSFSNWGSSATSSPYVLRDPATEQLKNQLFKAMRIRNKFSKEYNTEIKAYKNKRKENLQATIQQATTVPATPSSTAQSPSMPLVFGGPDAGTIIPNPALLKSAPGKVQISNTYVGPPSGYTFGGKELPLISSLTQELQKVNAAIDTVYACDVQFAGPAVGNKSIWQKRVRAYVLSCAGGRLIFVHQPHLIRWAEHKAAGKVGMVSGDVDNFTNTMSRARNDGTRTVWWNIKTTDLTKKNRMRMLVHSLQP